MVCYFKLPQETRIYSLHWLNCHTFLTCTEAGILTLCLLLNNSIELKSFYILPYSAERWTTAACFINKNHFAIGDRKGNIYLYQLTKIHPVQIIKRAHNYLGITDLRLHENNLVSIGNYYDNFNSIQQTLVISGRNSVMKKYHVVEDTQLVLESSDKLPFSWLARYKENLILGFSSTNFIIWDRKKRCYILKYNCLGGHRSWDYISYDQTKFIYVKDAIINMLNFNLNELSSINVTQPYHSWEINAIKCLRFKNDTFLLISGGEDTTMRLLQTNMQDYTNVSHTLKSHLSSIRTISIFLVDGDTETYYVVSGGGRAQIILWEMRGSWQCAEKHVYRENIDKNESEMRIMDLLITKIDAERFLVIAACSDGKIKLFNITHESKLDLITNLSYECKCIIKITTLNVLNKLYLLTTATDGVINFWDLTEIVNRNGTPSPCHALQSHQSGINSLSCIAIKDETFLVLTGGDDSAIKLNLIRFLEEGIKNVAVREIVNYHHAQITGAVIVENYFFTSSTDQKLNAFQWRVVNEDEIICNFVNGYETSISDLQGMECVKVQCDIFKIILYGKGIEIIEIKM